ncbi:MAG: nucleotidyltransferase [Peptococcaceae bacterium BICA1-7]|nr:MAG: nucleotidyltransferase [Peptococcaceae bacterium BICA1-7]HBV96677.1 nucleotidyltransferase [Desulfotomaculum sp.]
MKAIIMAGGEGSRLRPLTCNRPKPMVPVMNRPMMAYIVELLKKHGITDIGVTLQYMPESIRDYFGNGSEFGVNMRYYVEETPLGTAGSVKNAATFLDDTFIVISGDALTDFDLSRATQFHGEKGSVATLVLTRVDTPLEYGVVITDRKGAITQFLEKPSWGEVFSDTVNTGIYVLEPQVLDYIEEGQIFDFSKDLFPLLLKEGKSINGVVLEGYWCDIGNLQQYLQAHLDTLSEKVKINIPALWKEGVYTSPGVEIDDSAIIKGPAFIGENCKIGAEARIDSFTVLGSNSIVGERATIKRSIAWSGAYIGSGAALRGAIMGSRVQVQNGSGIYEGAVIGSDTVIKENCIIKPDVKVWPHKVIEAGTTVQSSIVWGTRYPKKIFGLDGITGLANIETTPEFAARIAASFATVQGRGGRLAAGSDSYPASQMIKRAVISGMQSVGAVVADLGDGITPMHRFAVKSLELDGGVHVKVCPRRTDLVTMVFINKSGGNISRGVERKVENIMFREDFKRAASDRVMPLENVRGTAAQYVSSLLMAVKGPDKALEGIKIITAYDRKNLDRFIGPALDSAGIAHENIDFDFKGRARSWQAYREMLPQLAEAVVQGGADGGAVLDHNGDSLILLDERGRVISDDMLTALSALIVFKTKGGPVVVPVTAPDTIEKMAQIYGGKVIRTKTGVQDFIERVISLEGSVEGEGSYSQFMLHFDALGSLLSILAFTRSRGIGLGDLVDEIPAFYMNKKVVPVPWETKGTVIRKLIEEPEREMELLDGVKVFHKDGWALVLPDPEEPVCRIFSEGATMEIAESLADFYVDKISNMMN